jgi:hypothetical protein
VQKRSYSTTVACQIMAGMLLRPSHELGPPPRPRCQSPQPQHYRPGYCRPSNEPSAAQPLGRPGVLVTAPARALQRQHDMLLTSWVFRLVAAAWLVAFVLVVGFLWRATRWDSAQGNPRLARKPNTLRRDDADRAA